DKRDYFGEPSLWIGGALALLIFLPNLIWNIHHHFPFVELQANIRRAGRNVPFSLLSFMGELTLAMLPLTLPIWLAGLWYYLITEKGKPFRSLGWAWLVTVGLIIALNPRVYYAFPAFPILFAAGGRAWEMWLVHPRMAWIKTAYPVAMTLVSTVFSPFAIP